jgi:hypothetical protein
MHQRGNAGTRTAELKRWPSWLSREFVWMGSHIVPRG